MLQMWGKVWKSGGVGKYGGGVGKCFVRGRKSKEVWESVLGCGKVIGRGVGKCDRVWGSVRGGVGCVGKCVEVWEKCWGRCGMCEEVC